MNYDELAFVNHQLAGMLQAGLPLEGALKQLSTGMRRSRLRLELERLHSDLIEGIPLDQALSARRLPELYRAMLRAGAASNNLTGVLILLGDYYQQVHALWTRLKGLMVYPLIVLGAAVALSLALASTFTWLFLSDTLMEETMATRFRDSAPGLLVLWWLPSALLAITALVVIFVLATPRCRNWLRWKAPALREAALAQFAATFALMLNQGCQPREALDLLQRMENGRPLGIELSRWRERLAGGQSRINELAADSKILPPLFVWLIASAGEDWALGFRKAADIYRRRAQHYAEMALYAALPVSVLALGLLIIVQVLPFVAGFGIMFDWLSS